MLSKTQVQYDKATIVFDDLRKANQILKIWKHMLVKAKKQPGELQYICVRVSPGRDDVLTRAVAYGTDRYQILRVEGDPLGSGAELFRANLRGAPAQDDATLLVSMVTIEAALGLIRRTSSYARTDGKLVLRFGGPATISSTETVFVSVTAPGCMALDDVAINRTQGEAHVQYPRVWQLLGDRDTMLSNCDPDTQGRLAFNAPSFKLFEQITAVLGDASMGMEFPRQHRFSTGMTAYQQVYSRFHIDGRKGFEDVAAAVTLLTQSNNAIWMEWTK